MLCNEVSYSQPGFLKLIHSPKLTSKIANSFIQRYGGCIKLSVARNNIVVTLYVHG